MRDLDWEDDNYDREAGDTGPTLNPLAALLDCIPGFDAEQWEELLRKLQMSDDEEVPGLTISEALEVSYPVM